MLRISGALAFHFSMPNMPGAAESQEFKGVQVMKREHLQGDRVCVCVCVCERVSACRGETLWE